jgi:hypothetical protein
VKRRGDFLAVKRDAKGRFVKGTKAGPGRPKKKAVDLQNAPPLWDYNLLRQAALTFKVANKYDQLEILRCPCGNDDLAGFDYELDLKGHKLRARCKKCGRWNDYQEKHSWFIEPLPPDLTPEERRIVAMHRKGTVEWLDMP